MRVGVSVVYAAAMVSTPRVTRREVPALTPANARVHRASQRVPHIRACNSSKQKRSEAGELWLCRRSSSTRFCARRGRQAVKRLAAGERWVDLDLVFPSERGTLSDGPNVTPRFHKLLKRAGLPPMRFHDLRHACASLLLVQGVHPRVVMETLGHSQISVTMNTYSHVLPALQRDAADKMELALAR